MVALMVAVPAAALVASPFALIVATLTLEEVHAACPVMPMTEPSLNVPVALNCCEAPTLMLALAGGFSLYYLASRWRFSFPTELTFRQVWAGLAIVFLAAAGRFVAVVEGAG